MVVMAFLLTSNLPPQRMHFGYQENRPSILTVPRSLFSPFVTEPSPLVMDPGPLVCGSFSPHIRDLCIFLLNLLFSGLLYFTLPSLRHFLPGLTLFYGLYPSPLYSSSASVKLLATFLILPAFLNWSNLRGGHSPTYSFLFSPQCPPHRHALFVCPFSAPWSSIEDSRTCPGVTFQPHSLLCFHLTVPCLKSPLPTTFSPTSFFSSFTAPASKVATSICPPFSKWHHACSNSTVVIDTPSPLFELSNPDGRCYRRRPPFLSLFVL